MAVMFIKGAVAFLVYAAAFRIQVENGVLQVENVSRNIADTSGLDKNHVALQFDNLSQKIANTSGLENSSGLENTSGLLNTSPLHDLNPDEFKELADLGEGMKGKTRTAMYRGHKVVIKSAKPGFERHMKGSRSGDIAIFEKIQSSFTNGWPSGVVGCLGLLQPTNGDPCEGKRFPKVPCVVMEYVEGGPLNTLPQAVEEAVNYGIAQRRFGNTTDKYACTEILVQQLLEKAQLTVKDLWEAKVQRHDMNPANFVVPRSPAKLLERGIVWIDMGHERHGSSLDDNLKKLSDALDEAATKVKKDIAAQAEAEKTKASNTWLADVGTKLMSGRWKELIGSTADPKKVSIKDATETTKAPTKAQRKRIRIHRRAANGHP